MAGMVNGPAVAGGCELALAADLRVIGDGARFRLPRPAWESSRGRGCARDGTARGGLAKQVILGGQDITAAQAVDWETGSKRRRITHGGGPGVGSQHQRCLSVRHDVRPSGLSTKRLRMHRSSPSEPRRHRRRRALAGRLRQGMSHPFAVKELLLLGQPAQSASDSRISTKRLAASPAPKAVSRLKR